ncbi:MAG: chorismate-binding protein, partial [Cyanobacteria bacterium J06659_2]
CHGILTDGVTDGEILPRLHPTPAVGGFPKRPAREAIDQLEPFERGWYAAPVGWVSRNAAEFAVAIRSGLVVNHQLSLFSGAGIVPGSNPSDEWQEIENKLRAFTTLLNEVEDERALA